MVEVRLIPLGAHPRDIALDELARGVQLALPVRVIHEPYPRDIDFALDPSRKQYHSAELLEELLQLRGGTGTRLLGITPFDLFLPVFTFVFGQVRPDAHAAVFSTFRLHSEFYGLPQNAGLLLERSLKQALHELGHTFGLRHCLGRPCVMNSSTYVEDIDLKPPDFCLHCRASLSPVS